MKNIHVLLCIIFMHSAAHAMLSSCVPKSMRRVMNELTEGMVTSQPIQKEKRSIVFEQLEQNDQLILSDWQRMHSTLEGKYQDYLKDKLKECKETHISWNMDDLVKVGRAITKQDDVILKAIICTIHDEHGFTFTHTLIKDPDKLFELIKHNYISFGLNKHNFSALDYAIKNLEGYTQDADRITLDPDGFERASCSVYILLNYVKMIAFRHRAERVASDDFSPCCERHTLPEDLDFIESECSRDDVLVLRDECLKPLEQELVNNFFSRDLHSEEHNSFSFDYDVVSCHSAECATADSFGSHTEEPMVPVVNSMKSERASIIVLSDDHVTSKETGLIFVPFGQKLQLLKGEPKKGSKVIVKRSSDCYVWGLVRSRAVHNNIGIVYKKENNITSGDIFSLNDLYELAQ